MEHAIRHEIHVKLEENPAFYESLRERLEEIIEEHKQERIDAAEQLKLFLELKEELGAEHETAQEIGLTETACAIYGLLEKARPSEAKEPDPGFDEPNRDLASLLDDAVEPYTELVDWQLKDDIQRQMRSKIKKQLRESGMKGDDVEKLATDIVDLAKVRKG